MHMESGNPAAAPRGAVFTVAREWGARFDTPPGLAAPAKRRSKRVFDVVAGAAEVERYGLAMEEYRACKPGITGLWQVSGRNDVDYAERVELDRRYAWSWSLKGDLMILVRTLGVVARRSGAY